MRFAAPQWAHLTTIPAAEFPISQLNQKLAENIRESLQAVLLSRANQTGRLKQLRQPPAGQPRGRQRGHTELPAGRNGTF
jgi:hypothetical protein